MSRDDFSHKNDILQKALERIGLSVSDGVENSGHQKHSAEEDKTKERSLCTTILVDRANPAKLV